MLKVSFEFDEVTQKVSNLRVESSVVVDKNYDVLLDDSKLNLTGSAITKLGATAGDRISINY